MESNEMLLPDQNKNVCNADNPESAALEPNDKSTGCEIVSINENNEDQRPVEHKATQVMANNKYSSEYNFMLTDNSVRARLRRALSTHRFQVRARAGQQLHLLVQLIRSISFRLLSYHLLSFHQ